MPLASHYFAADVRAMPDDGNRYETVHGELLVTPAPGGFHQRVVQRLQRLLGNYLEAHGREDLLASPADISFDEDTLVQPDLFVGDMTIFNRTGRWADLRTLYLVIEVISPSSARGDRIAKRRLYQAQRIPEYWIVDIDQRHVERWTPNATVPDVIRERLTWHHPAIAEECVVDVQKLLTFG